MRIPRATALIVAATGAVATAITLAASAGAAAPSRTGRWAAGAPAVTAGIAPPHPHVAPGGSITVTTTAGAAYRRLPALLVDNALAAQDGWTVEATSPATSVLLGPGRRFATTWTVRAPAGARPGTYDLTATATYQPDDAISQSTVQVVVAPPPSRT